MIWTFLGRDIPACGFSLGLERIIVVMGEDALGALNDLELPLSQPAAWLPGEIQQLTPSIELLATPNIDESLDEDGAKRAFWQAFRALGAWWADLPPY